MQALQMRAGSQPAVKAQRQQNGAAVRPLASRAVAPHPRTLRTTTHAVANPTAVSKDMIDKCVNAIRFLAIDGEWGGCCCRGFTLGIARTPAQQVLLRSSGRGQRRSGGGWWMRCAPGPGASIAPRASCQHGSEHKEERPHLYSDGALSCARPDAARPAPTPPARAPGQQQAAQQAHLPSLQQASTQPGTRPRAPSTRATPPAPTQTGVNKAKSGHPGMPMGCAPMGYILYNEVMKHNPKNPQWFNRDRFVLSAGHGSM